MPDDVASVLFERINQLEGLVRDPIGAGAVIGSDVTIRNALDAWHQYRATTELSPDTGEATEHVRTEKNNVALVKRLIDHNVPLSRLNYTELHKWSKAIANRPTSVKTGKPIKPATARNCLKVIRMFVKWASHHYGWKRPEEWHEATKVIARRTTAEKREQAANIEQHYTRDELGMLWNFALPSERMLILLALNFGFAQAKIIALHKSDLASGELKSFKGKSSVFGCCTIWPETKQLAEIHFDSVPRRRQHIANRWNQLLDRVTRDHPQFKRHSFKWLRKTGSSLIRKISDGETASLYLSHGDATDDGLLEIYAAKNWSKLAGALDTLRGLLLPHLNSEAIAHRTYIPRGKVDRIRAGWAGGLSVMQIVEQVQVSRATAYRYCPPAVSDQAASRADISSPTTV